MSGKVRAFGLVELLVVLVVLIAIAAFVIPRYTGSRVTGVKQAGSPVASARDAVCRTNLGSVRQALAAARAVESEDGPPQSLEEVPGVPAELRRCPEGGEPYAYSASTGAVRCPHPGHETY